MTAHIDTGMPCGTTAERAIAGSDSAQNRISVHLSNIEYVPVFSSQEKTRMLWRFAYAFAKRTTDIAVSLTLLVALLPIYAIIAVLIKATDRGPILFWQTRVGEKGREFPFPKFRSMVPDADKYLDSILHLNDHKSGVTFKLKNDPRTTWIGRILRRTSFDEMPQLWCVLIGDMSLVGPRPAVPREVALYTLAERRRLEAKPGVTCIWQVSGRSKISFPKQVEMDVKYIDNQSLWLDIKLLVLTIPAVISGRGAY